MDDPHRNAPLILRLTYRGTPFKAVLPGDGAPGYLVTEVDARGEPLPDARIARVLTPEQVASYRARFARYLHCPPPPRPG